MVLCSIMTGKGFADLAILGDFSMAWLGLVMLFFIVVLGKKWLGEEFDLPYNTIGGFVGAFVPYLIVITTSCIPKWSLLAGILGWIVGAFASGYVIGDGGGGDYS